MPRSQQRQQVQLTSNPGKWFLPRGAPNKLLLLVKCLAIGGAFVVTVAEGVKDSRRKTLSLFECCVLRRKVTVECPGDIDIVL